MFVNLQLSCLNDALHWMPFSLLMATPAPICTHSIPFFITSLICTVTSVLSHQFVIIRAVRHCCLLCYCAGQQPKRHKAREVAPDPEKARLLMRQYLGGGIPSPPWESMGLSRPPVIAGKVLRLCTTCIIYMSASLDKFFFLDSF